MSQGVGLRGIDRFKVTVAGMAGPQRGVRISARPSLTDSLLSVLLSSSFREMRSDQELCQAGNVQLGK